MKPSDFFHEEEDPEWDLHGLNPERRFVTVFNIQLVERLRVSRQKGIDDLDAAYGLTQLARDELVSFGTDRSEKLSDEEISVVLRTLRAIHRRLGIDFDPPFRDFTGFHGYWSNHDMSGPGGWGARRGYLNELFNPIFSRLERLEAEQANSMSVRGVDGQLKNIIFASTGPKPRIVLRDAINNVIEVVENGQYCLFYDRPLSEAGLDWADLVDWWRATNGLQDLANVEVARSLYRRLAASLASPPEKTLFRTYCEQCAPVEQHPALLPQVYLHYDPTTRRERNGRPSILMRERMDFLLLLSHGVRIVLEVDGRQHYAEGDTASPRLYSEIVSDDRRLRLRGYEVYRFGGHELTTPGAADLLREFFDELLTRYEAD